MKVPRIVRVFLWFIAALLVLLCVASLALIYVPAPVERWLQDRVLVALRQRYGPDIQLKNLHVQIVPVFRVTGDDFRLPNRGDGDLPPFMTINHFTAQALPLELLRKPVRLSWVKLDGLVIHVPPKRDKSPEEAAAAPKHHTRLANFVIDRVDADGTDLFVLPKQAGPRANGVGTALVAPHQCRHWSGNAVHRRVDQS